MELPKAVLEAGVEPHSFSQEFNHVQDVLHWKLYILFRSSAE